MLEKMGWTKGKGLGVNEQGNTECCRLPYKNDTTGKKKINNKIILLFLYDISCSINIILY